MVPEIKYTQKGWRQTEGLEKESELSVVKAVTI